MVRTVRKVGAGSVSLRSLLLLPIVAWPSVSMLIVPFEKVIRLLDAKHHSPHVQFKSHAMLSVMSSPSVLVLFQLLYVVGALETV